MTTEDRVFMAHELIRYAEKHMDRADVEPDPVAARREQAQAANKLRAAADLLDDHGRLQD